MSELDRENRISRLKKHDNPISRELREMVLTGTKDLKTQWISVAQSLYPIWRDRLYEYWGYEKLEHYTEKELGLKKSVAMKLVKTYAFLEDQEPEILKTGFSDRDPNMIPELDAVSVLRCSRGKEHLSREDYEFLRRLVVDKAAPAAKVRQELKNILAEKEDLDEDEVKDKRKRAVVKKLRGAIDAFRSEVKSIELVHADLIQQVNALASKLAEEV